jgi:hypothetical protein
LDTSNGEGEVNADFVEPIPPSSGEMTKNNSIKIGSLAEDNKDMVPAGGENEKSQSKI